MKGIKTSKLSRQCEVTTTNRQQRYSTDYAHCILRDAALKNNGETTAGSDRRHSGDSYILGQDLFEAAQEAGISTVAVEREIINSRDTGFPNMTLGRPSNEIVSPEIKAWLHAKQREGRPLLQIRHRSKAWFLKTDLFSMHWMSFVLGAITVIESIFIVFNPPGNSSPTDREAELQNPSSTEVRDADRK